MKKQKLNSNNYLDKIPQKNADIAYNVGNDGKVTLEIENKGAFNRIAQKLLKKPKISYIHLDEFGSFVWQQIDGETDINIIGKAVDGHFGEKAHPLYERLVQFFEILKSYSFIIFKN